MRQQRPNPFSRQEMINRRRNIRKREILIDRLNKLPTLKLLKQPQRPRVEHKSSIEHNTKDSSLLCWYQGIKVLLWKWHTKNSPLFCRCPHISRIPHPIKRLLTSIIEKLADRQLFLFPKFYSLWYNSTNMVLLWDYDEKELKKSRRGRLLLLERMINFGPDEGEKIDLNEVEKHWNELKIDPDRRRYLKFLIWEK